MKKSNSLLDLEKMETQIIKTSFGDSVEIIPGDGPSEALRRLGASIEASTYEFSTYVAIFSAIQPKTCLDIGSNIGDHALFFAKPCERVYAFEPNPYIYPVLRRNIERNNANIRAFPFGLSDTAAELPLHLNLNYNTGGSSFIAENFIPKELKNSRQVPAKVEIGDEVIVQEQIGRVDFIKIDTEGFEAKVLLGLQQCIQREKPVVALEGDSDFTRKGFQEHGLFKAFFSDYLCFGLGSFYNKCFYPTIISKIKRGILKNILKIKRSELALQKFMFASNYDIIFLIPERFQQAARNFSFLPVDYLPTVGSIE